MDLFLSKIVWKLFGLTRTFFGSTTWRLFFVHDVLQKNFLSGATINAHKIFFQVYVEDSSGNSDGSLFGITRC